MQGIISHFRGSRVHKTKGNHILIIVPEVTSREKAQTLVGKTVSWVAIGKKNTTINGKIAGAHGNKGVIRAIFERGLPGQAIGTEVALS